MRKGGKLRSREANARAPFHHHETLPRSGRGRPRSAPVMRQRNLPRRDGWHLVMDLLQDKGLEPMPESRWARLWMGRWLDGGRLRRRRLRRRLGDYETLSSEW